MSKKAMDDVDARELEQERLWRAEAEEVDTDEPVEVVVKRRPAHKNTKHWCKGKVGREHTLAIQLRPNASRQDCRWYDAHIDGIRPPIYVCQHVEMCTTCGKQLRHSYSWLADADPKTSIQREDCPDYRPLSAL